METTPNDLRPLARRLAADRDAAFPELVRELQDGLYSGLLRLTGNRSDAEELTQEAFLRAYRALEGYPAAQVRALKLRPWLWTITLNLSRNLARSRRRRPPPTSLDRAHEPVAADAPEDEAVARLDERWDGWLRRLSPPLRQAVVFRHVVGLSYGEIAAAMERPIGTVKSDVHRGVERLREILQTEGADL